MYLAAALIAGCGAKTGLLLEPRDAAPDAPSDTSTPRDCVLVDFEQGDVRLDLATDAQLAVADVFFLVDVTGSMSEEIDNIQRRLRDTIVPGIAEAIPEVRIGVGVLADFPVQPFGIEQDIPFELMLMITDDLVAAQSAVDRIPVLDGNDGPESQVEALYQVATGEGLGGWITPAPGCPTGGTGYPCFRRDALPVVLLFTDAPFHNGFAGGEQYFGISPAPHQWSDAVDALSSLGARFIGLDSSGPSDRGGFDDLRATADSLGSVDVDGDPLVFDIGANGSDLDTTVIDAVRTLATRVRFDVDAIVEDVPGDSVDGRVLVASLRPWVADPPSGVESIGDDAFHGVVPGTRLSFTLTLRNDVIERGETAQFIPIRIVFRGDYRSRLAIRDVDIVIPGQNGDDGCPPTE